MFYGVLLAILILISVFLVVFILLQSDKGGGLAGSLGGMGGGAMPFSGREAATILTKLTTWLAIFFMVICIVLNIMSRNRAHSAPNSALQKRAERVKKLESNAASAVLDQQMALPPQTGPEGAAQQQDQGENAPITIPGVTQEQPTPSQDAK
ncbi:MAG: preprotein translocase subunit SecG [Candidatus Raymondbacteria bacterium RifOxyA12_full_50_37]|uniref:Protein-export membrane protein SecG n=1 Tax=Candidatus Raymondbacteria bacterium RIFOXYD12_FULL_49_13 TaxID=1817890 RepID=A0A1F7F0Z7_UNCRA|nr:MAG: preprotein translocase subunit SecG [Candidatus Raymondbacteria bacterium RifOxyA12_full_50_37]OGJ93308.1 MAG: preprotein translocase subunit SecG [Candidatus Raymondbacteria bacterium RifOxyC12_full_50_8]OGJ93538.1 MAG: preprotein translocase subunit SecG [Candidatus Raymondbacteria bacterium RIFOXYA2_FULL_49_16]OGJ98808.1 MAG: preprotein translocase subunit SecG [Candidatus Raymondbacteria bacterium RIFOXYC2_FULL_50_21]OGK00329.1 MAG: preprotein translocase subunit SecG [Candidatus Ra